MKKLLAVLILAASTSFAYGGCDQGCGGCSSCPAPRQWTSSGGSYVPPSSCSQQRCTSQPYMQGGSQNQPYMQGGQYPQGGAYSQGYQDQGQSYAPYSQGYHYQGGQGQSYAPYSQGSQYSQNRPGQAGQGQYQQYQSSQSGSFSQPGSR